MAMNARATIDYHDGRRWEFNVEGVHVMHDCQIDGMVPRGSVTLDIVGDAVTSHKPHSTQEDRNNEYQIAADYIEENLGLPNAVALLRCCAGASTARVDDILQLFYQYAKIVVGQADSEADDVLLSVIAKNDPNIFPGGDIALHALGFVVITNRENAELDGKTEDLARTITQHA